MKQPSSSSSSKPERPAPGGQLTLLLALTCSLALLGCPADPPPPIDPEPEPEPTAEECAGYAREIPCLEAGCTVFVTANLLEDSAEGPGGCALGASVGVCLLAEPAEEPAALLIPNPGNFLDAVCYPCVLMMNAGG